MKNNTPTLLPGNVAPERYEYTVLAAACRKTERLFVRCGNHTTAQLDPQSNEVSLFYYRKLIATLRYDSATLTPQGSRSDATVTRLERVAKAYGYDFRLCGDDEYIVQRPTPHYPDRQQFSHTVRINRVTRRKARS